MPSNSYKVVIRILPPDIDEEDLVSTFPTGIKLAKLDTPGAKNSSEKDWIRFHRGKRFKGDSKASINARCYVAFDSANLAEKFIAQYHEHAFVDEKGQSFRAVCCYAPFQKIAKPSKDKLIGTLESDPTYQKWLENKGVDIAPTEKENEPMVDGETPLLQHVRSTIQKRRREQKRKDKSWYPEDKRRCYNCGTKKRLDEDEAGRVWCRHCWDGWKDDRGDDDYSREKSSRNGAGSRRKKHESDLEYGEEKANCPGRHGLKKFLVDGAGWWCSLCSSRVSKGKKMFGCRICDFDCCGKCSSRHDHDRDKESRHDHERDREIRHDSERDKEKKRRKERDRSAEKGSRWEPKKRDEVRIGELKDIDEDNEDETGRKSAHEKERERKRLKKRRKREELATGGREKDFYSDTCHSCGSSRRLQEASNGVVYCAKCVEKWDTWDTKEKWVKK